MWSGLLCKDRNVSSVLQKKRLEKVRWEEVGGAESFQLKKEQEQSEEVEERKYHCYESMVGACRIIIDKTPFQVKLWSSQLWTQILQLRREAWKIQDFNGVWTRDLAIPVRHSNQMSYEATDVGSWSFVGSNGPVRNESMMKWYMKWIIYELRFIYSFLTGPLEPTNDQLPTSVAS